MYLRRVGWRISCHSSVRSLLALNMIYKWRDCRTARPWYIGRITSQSDLFLQQLSQPSEAGIEGGRRGNTKYWGRIYHSLLSSDLIPPPQTTSSAGERLTSFFSWGITTLELFSFSENWVVSFMLSNQLYFECFRNCPARWMDVSLHLIIIDSSQRSPKETFSCDPIKAGVGQTPLNHHLSLIIYSLVLLIMYCNMCYRYQSLSNISQLL